MQNYASVVYVRAMNEVVDEVLQPGYFYTASANGDFNACPINNTLSMIACNKFNVNIGGEAATGNFGVTINDAKAYVGNWVRVADNNTQMTKVYSCDVNKRTGVFSNCVVAGTNSGNKFMDPKGMLIHSGVAYLNNSRDLNGTISICPLLSNGALDRCESHVTNLVYITKMTIKDSKIYLTGGTVSDIAGANTEVCSIADNGSLYDCENTPHEGLTRIYNDIAVDRFHAYMTNATDNYIAVCQVEVNGSLSDRCHKISGASLGGVVPAKIALYGRSAYIADSTGLNLVACSLNSVAGEITGCRKLGDTYNFIRMSIFSW